MISFTIDSSVFALKAEDNNQDKEFYNIQQFILNMYSLHELVRCQTITISYMNYIFKKLIDDSLCPIFPNKNLRNRIENIRKYKEIDKYSPDLLYFFETIHLKIIPKLNKDNTKRKGKIGIYNNIPDRDNDPDRKYKNIVYNTNIYPFRKAKSTSDYFKLYLGYIGKLNSSYHSTDNNYLLIGGDTSNIQENVTLCFNNFKLVFVNISGIQKANVIYKPKKDKFNTLFHACEEAIKKYSSNYFIFCNDVNKENIEKGLARDAGTPIKIFHYLGSLHDITKLIIDDNIIFNNKDIDLVEMINSHGLLCSYDRPIYKNIGCECRKFKIENGKIIFDIHLKPSTYSYEVSDEEDDANNYVLASKYTVRICLDWDSSNKKMIIGWIGRHPPFCHNCVHVKCPNYKP